jgi:Fe-S-cluster-containing dehydrogenase component/formate-dependent nitrite reductase membrane component NrfD
VQYGFIIDQDSCIGCHACTVACKTEHEVPLGVNRTWVKYVEKGTWPDTKRFFSVMRCNHCTNAPCVQICPTSALHHRTDGIVDFDTDRCIGCKSCMQACPYDALYIDPAEHTVCPEQAIIAGDVDNPATKIAQWVATEQLYQRAPEQGTGPNLWYKGAESANLDPLGAERPGDGGIWRDAPGIDQSWLSVDLTDRTPAPAGPTVQHDDDAPARVVYANEFPMPWGWRVSSYFLTKGIAAGIAIAAVAAQLLDADLGTDWLRWMGPLVAGLFLLLTGVLLVWDLKRPDRFLYLLTKGNPKSWLVRGSWILGAYAAALAVWFLAGVADQPDIVEIAIPIAAVIALGVAGYTAFLFGQAEARDLWQNPTLLWHMLAGAFVAGGGASLLAALAIEPGDDGAEAFGWVLTIGAAAILLLALVEIVSRHPTRNVAAAVHHMTRGAFALEWWTGLVLAGIVPIVFGSGVVSGSPVWVGAVGGAAGLVGIWLMDDAFVKAGQSVPLS